MVIGKLDEASAGSTIIDYSISEDDGTPQGTGGANNLPQPFASNSNINFTNPQSLDFDGTDDYILVK